MVDRFNDMLKYQNEENKKQKQKKCHTRTQNY